MIMEPGSPTYALCKLETENVIQSQSKVLRTRSFDTLGQEKMDAQLHFFFFSFSIRALNGLDDAYPCWWGWIFFPQSIDCNANLFQKHHWNNATNNVLSVIWASLTLASQVDAIKLTIREMGELITSLRYFHSKVQRIILNKKQTKWHNSSISKKEGKYNEEKNINPTDGKLEKKITRLVENTNYGRINNIC